MCIRDSEGADPAAVIFDAVQSAAAKKIDIVICDTAGRLHNKKNLMAELSKISRVVNKACETASVETLLVLDAITGQNAINQASQFIDAAGATGVCLLYTSRCVIRDRVFAALYCDAYPGLPAHGGQYGTSAFSG